MSSPNERNWRGIFIALLVIVAVLGLIVFSIVLVSPPEEGPRVKGRKPTLEDIFLKLPPVPRFNGTWISGEFNYPRCPRCKSINKENNFQPPRPTSPLGGRRKLRTHTSLDQRTTTLKCNSRPSTSSLTPEFFPGRFPRTGA